MKVQLTPNFEVANFSRPYVIAELGSNHNGDMELAKKLILEAKEAGAHCVKFQSWSKDSIFSKTKYDENCFIADDYRDRDDYTLEGIVDDFAISEQELIDMKKFADEVGIDCTSTPFSYKEADFLIDVLESPFIKVASMDVNNYPFIEYLAKKGKPIVLSTGLSELYEIDQAIQTIENVGNSQIVILHCTAIYPPQDNQVNLNNIDTFQKLYPYPIGFSDHSLGVEIPIASVAKGVCLIEKHFTLNKEMFGWDHKVSADKEDMRKIVEGSARIVEAMGSFRIASPEDAHRKEEFRRSIVLSKAMKAGDKLELSDLDFKRPGRGISPCDLKYVVGRTLKVDKEFDGILQFEDLV